jgi:hypothetical protein
MEIIDQLFDDDFELPCSKIVFVRRAGNPIQIEGPGSIEIDANGDFHITIHVSVKTSHEVFLFGYQSIPLSGTPFPDESIFELTATTYVNGTWHGEVIRPIGGGTLGEPGLVYGTLNRMTLEEEHPDSKLEAVSMIFPGELNFPPLESTERYEKVNGVDQLVYAKYDHSKLTIGSEEFTFLHHEKYTEVYCRLNPGAIQRNAHRRMQEALGFALSSPIWPQATTKYSEGKKSITIFSPSERHDFKGNLPPFHFGMQEREIRRHFFGIVSAYYQKILSHHDDREHPVSRGLFLVMEAFRSYADVQVLTLGVAGEYLIKKTFPNIASVDEDFAREVADLRKDLKKMSLGERLKSRVFGFLGLMVEPSPYEMIWRFCEIYGLEEGVADAWRDSRNPTAHGDFPDPEDFVETLKNRHKVLYLCYAIVLAFIGYEGSHSPGERDAKYSGYSRARDSRFPSSDCA